MPSAKSDRLAALADFFPTLASLAAIDLPEPWGIEGVSFAPTLRGQVNPSARTWIYTHYDPRWGRWSDSRIRFATNRRYKLDSRGRLFDFVDDPLEASPVAVDDALRPIVARLRAVLAGNPELP